MICYIMLLCHLRYVVLFYAMLCYAMLCYVIACYSMLCLWYEHKTAGQLNYFNYAALIVREAACRATASRPWRDHVS